MGRSHQMLFERRILPDQCVQLTFRRNHHEEIWTISADRKSARLGPKMVDISEILNPGDQGEDYLWSDPAEIFLRAQEYAQYDQGQRVLRRFLVPASAGVTAALTFQFHSEGENVCRIESVDFSFKKRKLGFHSKSLVVRGKIDGLYPEEIQLTGFDPFSFLLKGERTK